ncbi:uncharacterized protein LOC132632902 isoform X1 [Lycium barbarum]|uniref:uncharacterized protein LOC132632902 isoform X1 n=2 Tax=Lycium barbarum TaxID=112863 RepID=UPI00293F11F4|nr:uncharacterized protein LOC132632902 isoform X1 [Lycium barbarum]
MQCTSYIPGYHPKDSLGGNSWSIPHNDIAWNGARGFYVSLPPPFMADQSLELVHQKEILKQTILKHEAIFRYQVNELHRVYRRQSELMDEIKRRKPVEDHLHLQALESKSFVSQLRPEISHKSRCPLVLDQTSIEPSTLRRETFQGSSNSIAGQRVQPGAYLLTEQNLAKEWKISSSKSSTSRKRMLDLELPAEEYIDIEDEEQFVEERPVQGLNVEERPVQGPNILISELSKANFVNPGDSSISNSSPRGTFHLFDLNEPIQLDETGYPNSTLESINVHEEISNMDQDLSGTADAECSTLKKEVTGGDISNLNSSDEVSSVERTLLQCKQTASSTTRFVDKCRNGTKTAQKKIKEMPFAVQALPCFVSNASLSKSPKSSVGNSCLTGKKSDLYNSSASSPTSGTSGSCLMKYGDNESTSGQTDAVKLSKIPDSLCSMKVMDLNCTPSPDLSDNQFSAPTSNISPLNLPEGGATDICEKSVLLDCILRPDSALESRNSTTNSCINCIKDETLSPGHSEATMTPVSPENKECSPPRGDSLDNTIGKSVRWSKKDHMSDHTGKTDRAAAETLLFISSSVARGDSKTAKGGTSEAAQDYLGWLADIATSLASNPQNEVGKEKEAVFNTLHIRSKRSRPRSAKYKRVLPTEILPATVSLHQLNGELLAMGGLKSPANAASESGPWMKTPRRASSRSRRCSHIGGRTTCSLLQPHPSNDKQGITDRFCKGWGETKERQNSRRARSISSFS